MPSISGLQIAKYISENYKNVISKDEIIIKALVSATMQIRKKDEKLSDKYLKELEKLKIFKVVKVD